VQLRVLTLSLCVSRGTAFSLAFRPARHRRFPAALRAQAGGAAAAGAALALSPQLRVSARSSGAYHAAVRLVAMPLVRLLDPERAHTLAVRLAALGLTPVDGDAADPALTVRLWGLTFPSPVGLAAGFDKQVSAL